MELASRLLASLTSLCKVAICVFEVTTYNLYGYSLMQQLARCGVLIPGYTQESFDWNNYQKLTKFIAAPKSLFSNTQVAVSRVRSCTLWLQFIYLKMYNSDLVFLHFIWCDYFKHILQSWHALCYVYVELAAIPIVIVITGPTVLWHIPLIWFRSFDLFNGRRIIDGICMFAFTAICLT